MLVVQNKGNGGNIGVYQINHAGIELYFYTEVVFGFSEPIWRLATQVKTFLRPKEGHMTQAKAGSVWQIR